MSDNNNIRVNRIPHLFKIKTIETYLEFVIKKHIECLLRKEEIVFVINCKIKEETADVVYMKLEDYKKLNERTAKLAPKLNTREVIAVIYTIPNGNTLEMALELIIDVKMLLSLLKVTTQDISDSKTLMELLVAWNKLKYEDRMDIVGHVDLWKKSCDITGLGMTILTFVDPSQDQVEIDKLCEDCDFNATFERLQLLTKTGMLTFLSMKDDSGSFIGFIAFWDPRAGKIAGVKDAAYLHVFAVKKEYRGRGFGSMHLNSVINEIDRKAKCRIVVDSRPESISLYEKFGFKRLSDEEGPDGTIRMIR